MPDRLQELLHQRAAIQAHLAWLDREIAQLHPTPSAQSAAATQPLEKTSAPPRPAREYPPPHADPEALDSPAPLAIALPPLPPSEVDPDAILTRYQQDTVNLRTDVRKGCLLYFFGAFALLGFAIALFYFINTRFFHPSSQPAPVEQNAAPAR
jgi:hypothetical protein